jgi:hypothetical protein
MITSVTEYYYSVELRVILYVLRAYIINKFI